LKSLNDAALRRESKIGELRVIVPNHLTRLIHYDWLQPVTSSVAIKYDLGDLPEMAGAHGFHRRCDIGSSRALSAKIVLCTVGFSLALGAAEARATQAAPAGAIVQPASNPGLATHDLGALPSPPDSDTPTPASASTVSSAQPVPELPIWAMLLLFFGGLGLAKLKRGRRDRLSPGIE
jgi:hypothetical protein